MIDSMESEHSHSQSGKNGEISYLDKAQFPRASINVDDQGDEF